MREQWKKIKDFPKYEISNYGRLRSYNDYIKSNIGRIMKGWDNPKGYHMACLCGENGRRYTTVGRLVLETFTEMPEGKAEVNHKDLNKKNNHLSNLEWVTPSGNIRHAYKNNAITIQYGELCNLAKLTEKEVLKIRQMKIDDPEISNLELAEIFNTSATNISKIILRKRWKHI